MKPTTLRLLLATPILLYGLRCLGQSPQQHSADCWLENHSGYGISLSGTNPSLGEIHDKIRSLSLTYNVPIEIIAAVAYHESGLYQYGSDSFVIHNKTECRYCFNDPNHDEINPPGTRPKGTAPPPGLGMMQLTGPTASGSSNVPRLITDWQFNLEEGVKVLVNKYNSALASDPEWMRQLERENMLVRPSN